jgi:hypothetical protein
MPNAYEMADFMSIHDKNDACYVKDCDNPMEDFPDLNIGNELLNKYAAKGGLPHMREVAKIKTSTYSKMHI